MRFLTIHEQKILTFLHGRGWCTTREVINNVGGSFATLIKAINSLIELGLMKEYREPTFPFRRYIALTEKGEKVARHLLEVLNTINT